MKEVGKDTFGSEVVQSDRPVVVDFWGPQCGPCLALMPEVAALGDKYADKVKITKVEAPKNRRLCLALKVLALPTFLFYKEGKEYGRVSGNNVSIQMIEDSIQKMLS
jgi:thioredoxin 1